MLTATRKDCSGTDGQFVSGTFESRSFFMNRTATRFDWGIWLQFDPLIGQNLVAPSGLKRQCRLKQADLRAHLRHVD
jgi:hypothetical protein